MSKEQHEIIQFVDDEFTLEVQVSPEEDTVWLTQKQMAELFGKGQSTIAEHINNVFKEGEVDEHTSIGISDRSKNVRNRPPKIYNLDVIISVGYRVKSQRGIQFRKWANKVLKEYLLKGYAINQRKLNIPDYEHIVSLLENYRNMDGEFYLSGNSMLDFLVAYNKGLKILDDYDHHSIEVPNGNQDIYQITYEECMDVIRTSMFQDKGDNFAIERDDSFQSSIATIYQRTMYCIEMEKSELVMRH